MSFQDYFDRIICINLDRSPDRWAHVEEQKSKFSLTKLERFRAYDFHDYDSLPGELRAPMDNAMSGCSASHAAVIHAAAWNNWPRTLILEDDFLILHDDFESRWAEQLPFIPDDWDLLYIGAHYGNKPLSRVNSHLVRGDNIKTTSSYAITSRFARFIAPFICGRSGTDDMVSGLNRVAKAYVLQPRLMVQMECRSTIWGTFTNNGLCMTDPNHEKMV